MKSFCLIVSLRLALFHLAFNLSFAQEVEVNTNESSFWTSKNEVKNLRWEVDEQDIQDSSLRPEWQTWSELNSLEQIIQNYEENISLIKEEDHEVMEDLNKEESNTSMDSSLRSEWQDYLPCLFFQ